MDIYLTALALGGVGLVGMAVGGLGRHGSGPHSASGHGAAGHGSVGHGAGSHGAAGHAHGSHSQGQSSTNPLVALMSPRVLFSICLGLGTAGLVLRDFLGGPLLFAASLGVGILFERLLVSPIWNLAFRFASNPAATLEGSVMDEATAVTTFDRNGQGLIAVEVDGQMVQILGTLQAGDREMKVKVPVGSRLRIQDVDAARNRCTVSLI
jgi:hypothetical protein